MQCLLFEESEALLHRDLCLKGQHGARDRGSRQARCSNDSAIRDYLALKRMLKHTLHDGEERGSLLRREVVLFTKQQIVETEIDENGAARVVLIVPNTHRRGERAVDRRGTSAFCSAPRHGERTPPRAPDFLGSVLRLHDRVQNVCAQTLHITASVISREACDDRGAAAALQVGA